MTTAFPFFLTGNREGLLQLRRRWGWFLVLGIALLVVGMLAIAYPGIASATTVEVYGYFLVIGAAVEVVSIIWAPGWGGFLLHFLGGLLYLFLGAILIEHPGVGMLAATLLLAVFLVASGLVRIIMAFSQRFPGWGWTVFGGVISLILGVMIWRQLPVSAVWVIGTFVGIDLLCNGWSWIMLALGLRNLPAEQVPANPHVRQPV
jgi:uncharacterized membrane protein HdeD (DUF308 family)